MRDYSGVGAKKFFDLLEKKKAELEKVFEPIKGFVSYSVVRTARGGSRSLSARTKRGLMRARAQHAIGSRRMQAILAWPRRRSRKAQSCCTF
jgi:hypothetical protein